MQYLVWLQIDAAEQEICGFHFILLSACQYLGMFMSVSAKLVHQPDRNHDLGNNARNGNCCEVYFVLYNV